MLRHLNKVEGMNSLYRGSGSVSIIAAVRAGLLVARDPTRLDENNIFILAVNKANLAGPCQSIRYRIVDECGIGRIEFLELVDLDARQLVGANYKQAEEGAAANVAQAPAFAIEFLQQALDKGPRRLKELKELAEEARIAWSTIKRARRELWIEERKAGFGGEFVWELVRLPRDLLKAEGTSESPQAH